MKAEEKVKRLWPKAEVKQTSKGFYAVEIRPGLLVYSAHRKSWAWAEAWRFITQDEELSAGQPQPEGRE